MKATDRSHVWWPHIDDFAHKVKSCAVCQEYQHVQWRLWPLLEKLWSHLHVDFGGPFEGHYFLLIVDAYSKWIVIIPVTSFDATIRSLETLLSTNSILDIIVSDNGTGFTGIKCQQFLKRHQIRGITVPPYYLA